MNYSLLQLMAKTTATARVTIQNSLGLHARPAMSFVEVATEHDATVKVKKGKQEVDGKSIMQMMLLAATKGTELEIIAEGQDAAAAIKALCALIDSGFDED